MAHEDVSIRRGHMGPHCRSLDLLVVGAIESEIVVGKDDVDQMIHVAGWRCGDYPRVQGHSAGFQAFQVWYVFV